MPGELEGQGGPVYVCDRCGMPAVLVDGRWRHAEAADAAFCQLVFPR